MDDTFLIKYSVPFWEADTIFKIPTKPEFSEGNLIEHYCYFGFSFRCKFHYSTGLLSIVVVDICDFKVGRVGGGVGGRYT